MKQADQHNAEQKNKEALEKLRPIDDDLFRELLRNNPSLAQYILRIIIGDDTLKITAQETQYDLKMLPGARSLRLDYVGRNLRARIVYDMEPDRHDSSPERLRYHQSALDVEFFETGKDFKKLPTTYVIFISEKDIYECNKPIYYIDRVVTNLNKTFNDREHILIVNGAYNNKKDKSNLSKLIHDFNCKNADDMYHEPLAERTRYFKETKKGVSHMCKVMEDRVNEAVNEAVKETKKEVTKSVTKKNSISFAKKLILKGILSTEDIAECSGLTVDEVNKLAKKAKPAQ